MKKPISKNYTHVFSPLQMIKNYIKDTKTSIEQFFKQYLKTEGKDKLLIFNRYMIIVMVLNVDIQFMCVFALMVLVVVKVLKVRIWQKYRKSIISGCLNKLKHIRNEGIKLGQNKNKIEYYDLGQIQSKSKCYDKNKQNSNKKQQNNRFQMRWNLEQIQQTQQSQEYCQKLQIISNFHSSTLQHKIYELINTCIKSYCTFIWFIKWKSILILSFVMALTYLFEPQLHSDAFHIITTQRNGQLQIQSIKKASEYINEFYLLAIWVGTNICMFYKYGTIQLKNQLIQELYTREYKQDVARKSKFKGKRVYTKDDGLLKIRKKQNLQQLVSPMRLKSTITKSNTSQNNPIRPINIQQLIQFSLKKNLKTKTSSELIFSQEGQAKMKIKIQRCDSIMYEAQLCRQQKQNVATSQPLSQPDDKYRNNSYPNNAGNNILNSKDQNSTVFELNQSKKPKLSRKSTFLPASNNQNLLKRARKPAEEYKNLQKHDNSKLNLLKCQTPVKNRQKIG